MNFKKIIISFYSPPSYSRCLSTFLGPLDPFAALSHSICLALSHSIHLARTHLTTALQHSHQARQSELLKSPSTSIVFLLWRLLNAQSLMQMLVLAVFWQKIQVGHTHIGIQCILYTHTKNLGFQILCFFFN